MERLRRAERQQIAGTYLTSEAKVRNTEDESSGPCSGKATAGRIPGNPEVVPNRKSACRKSHQKVPRDALVSTNGVVPRWSADRERSPSAETTTANSRRSNAPPFLPCFCIGAKPRKIRDGGYTNPACRRADSERAQRRHYS